MKNNRHELIFSATLSVGLVLPNTAFAYIGPGAGLSFLGVILSLIAAFILAIVGFVWYPVRRILRRKHRLQEPNVAPTEQERNTVSQSIGD